MKVKGAEHIAQMLKWNKVLETLVIGLLHIKV